MNVDRHIELLVSSARLSEALSLPVNAVTLGSEGCPHKIPDVDTLLRAADRVRESGRQFTLLMPVCYDSYLESMRSAVVAVTAEGPTNIIVNDWGMLIALADERRLNTKVIVGQALSYSIGAHPWGERDLAVEGHAQRLALLRNSLADETSLALLRELSVDGIIVAALSDSADCCGELESAGLEVTLALDAVPLAYARACPTARYYGMAPPNCQAQCDGEFTLSVTHRWRLMHNEVEPLLPQLTKDVAALSVFGNVVYGRLPARSEAHAPRVALDCRWYSPGQLHTRISQLRDA